MELRHRLRSTLNGAEQLHEQIDTLVAALVRAANDSAAAAGGDQRVKRVSVEVHEHESLHAYGGPLTPSTYLAHEFELELVTELL